MFYQIEFALTNLDPEAVETALFDIGASSITFVDRGDEPVLEPGPGEIRLWSDTLVRALFQAPDDDPAQAPAQDAAHRHGKARDFHGAAVPLQAPDSHDAQGQNAAHRRSKARDFHGAAVPLPAPDLHDAQGQNAAHRRSNARDFHDAALQQLASLAARFGSHITENARVRGVANQDWERVWLKDWKAMRFGRRLWVCPTAAPPPADIAAVVVRLDPGLAFGTGTHPTTALCLQILDSFTLQGRSLIDYGCGSGILGIAALKMGAAHVTAVDLDPQALLATRENAGRNDVSTAIEVQGVSATLPPASCVVANILAGPLIELAPLLTQACEPGGDLLLSGLLKTQAYEVKAAYTSAFDIVQVVGRDDWCCIHARRRM